MALLPALYAENSDMILCLDPDAIAGPESPFFTMLKIKGNSVIGLHALSAFIEKYPEDGKPISVNPWGWNSSLLNMLKKIQGERNVLKLPREQEISHLRELSHRKLSIEFMRMMRDEGFTDAPIPEMFTAHDEAMQFFYSNSDCFFKAPWSSSGRGILYAGDLEIRHISPWISGIIHSQGAVMGEIRMPKIFDFASEWQCIDGKAEFTGFSIFDSSTRGKYHYNLIKLRGELRKMIEEATDHDIDPLLEAQRKGLDQLVAPGYDGYVGIDMIMSPEGRINPCIELNLRHTMGIIACKVADTLYGENRISDNGLIIDELKKLFPDNQLNFNNLCFKQ